MDVQIGPFPQDIAESITEEMLNSKDFYTQLERLLKGDIDSTRFLYYIQICSEDCAQEIEASKDERRGEE